MKITFRPPVSLQRGYSISVLPAAGAGLPSFLAGSEDDAPLLLLEAPDFQPRVISDAPGGYISTWPLVRDGRRFVVATSLFKPGFNGADSDIRLYPLDDGERPEPVHLAKVPYIHRLALMTHATGEYLLISTLCAGKEFKEDWTQPGGIHMAKVPADLTQPWEVRQIVHGLNKNHGLEYACIGRERRPGYLLSCLEGLHFMPVPPDPAGEWVTEEIDGRECSDAYACDWDGDGVPEIFSISPFHGNVLSIHRQTEAGWSREEIADDLALGHIVWAGDFLGRPGLLAGSRRQRCELRLYRPAPNGGVDPQYTVIDEGIGPSQLVVIPRGPGALSIYMAAHSRNEIRIYDVEA